MVRGSSIVARAVARAIKVIGRRHGFNRTVGITREIRDGGTSRAVHHVVDQVFLIVKPIDGVLVLDQTGDGRVQGYGVDPITIIICHGVVHIIGTPAAPWARDKHIGKSFWRASHVDVECGLGEGTQTEQPHGCNRKKSHENCIGSLRIEAWAKARAQVVKRSFLLRTRYTTLLTLWHVFAEQIEVGLHKTLILDKTSVLRNARLRHRLPCGSRPLNGLLHSVHPQRLLQRHIPSQAHL